MFVLFWEDTDSDVSAKMQFDERRLRSKVRKKREKATVVGGFFGE